MASFVTVSVLFSLSMTAGSGVLFLYYLPYCHSSSFGNIPHHVAFECLVLFADSFLTKEIIAPINKSKAALVQRMLLIIAIFLIWNQHADANDDEEYGPIFIPVNIGNEVDNEKDNAEYDET